MILSTVGVPDPGGGVSAREGGSAPGGGAWWGAPLPRDGYCCGRYASYWNAFLFECVNGALKGYV